MLSVNKSNSKYELTKAESTLMELETKLDNIRSILDERKAERRDLDAQPHTMTATGDINKMMALRSRAIALDKTIADLTAAEKECAERVDSSRRYLYSLYIRLERLRQEAISLRVKLSFDDLPPEASTELQASLRRVRIQIEAISGAD